MHVRRFRVRPRFGAGLSALALVGLLTLSLSLGGPRPAQAIIGDCTPGSNWGTLSSSFASQVLTLVNQHRTAMGLTALQVSPTLTASAQWKSLHMAYYQYMDHDDPSPPVARSWSDRLAACGYPSAWEGENIAYGYATPQDVMTGWLNSPGHRANIESPNYLAIGIGAAQAANGLWYWTQDFGSVVDGGSTGGGTTGGGGGTPSAGGGVTAPTVMLTSTPPASSTSTTAGFAWSTTGSPTGTTCSLDGGTPATCSSPTGYNGLANGTHTFTVTVSNSGGSSSASFSWNVTPAQPQPQPQPQSQPQPQPQPQSAAKPTVTLSSTPDASTTATGATFAWTTTNGPTSVTCSLDGATASSCTTPAVLSGLGTGGHTFTVTAANSGGSDSATYSWVITAAAPQTTASPAAPTVTLTSAPPATTANATAAFAWSTTGNPTSTTCSLDGATPVECSSPAGYPGLAPGGHTFVVAVSSAGGSRSAMARWTVTAKPPRIIFSHGGGHRGTTATLAWTVSGSVKTVTCSLDGRPPRRCASPARVTVAGGGTHTFTVSASSNSGRSTKSFSWTT